LKIQQFGLCGFPLEHSLSPYIHHELFCLRNLHHIYELYSQESFDDKSGVWALDGFNITIPHKQAAPPLLSKLDDTAVIYGAVNTVDCRTKTGYNTDGYGLMKALGGAGLPLKGRVLVCGAGGTGRMAAMLAATNGCFVTVAVRDSGMAAAVALQSHAAGYGVNIDIVTYGDIGGEFDLLINTTPVGMYPNPNAAILPEEQIARFGGVFDVVYNPSITLLVSNARKAGIPAVNGLAMLVWQAARAQEIWCGSSFDEHEINTVIRKTAIKLEAYK